MRYNEGNNNCVERTSLWAYDDANGRLTFSVLNSYNIVYIYFLKEGVSRSFDSLISKVLVRMLRFYVSNGKISISYQIKILSSITECSGGKLCMMSLSLAQV